MGLVPSKTELFLPADTIHPCHPDRCWCNGGHHRSVKWIYTERGSDGRERNHDALDMMRDFMMGYGGGGMGGSGGGNYPMMPWRPAKDWSIRDYERLGEILHEYYARENGRRGGGGGMYPGPPMTPGFEGGGRRRHRYYPSWTELERWQASVDDKFRRMAEEYQRHMQERDAFLFGTESDVRKERYRSNMLKTMQELMPQLAQMMAAASAHGQMGGGLGAYGPPGMMGMGGVPLNMAAGGMGNVPPPLAPMGGAAGNPWAAGAMGNMGVNPMAAAMAQGMANPAGMNPQAWPDAMPSNNARWMAGEMGNGWPMRHWRRRKLPLDDGFAHGMGPGFAGHPMHGHPARRPWDDGDDMLGGGYGPDMPGGPRRPPHDPLPPRRPPPDYPPGDLGGAGGVAFEDDHFRRSPNPLDHPRPGFARHAHNNHLHDPLRDPLYPSDFIHERRPASPIGPSIYVNPPTAPPLRPGDPIMTGGRGPRTPEMMHGTARDNFTAPIGTAFRSTEYPAGLGAHPDRPDFPGSHLGPQLGSSYVRPGFDGGRGAAYGETFQPEAKLAQSREAEAHRGEVPLGSQAQKRDL